MESQPNDRNRTTMPNSGWPSRRSSRARSTEIRTGPNRSDRASRLRVRNCHRTHGHLRCHPGGPSVHMTQLQDCRELPEGSMRKTAQIHSKADQEHQLYDWFERSPCEVAIQAARAERGGPRGVVSWPLRERRRAGNSGAGGGGFDPRACHLRAAPAATGRRVRRDGTEFGGAGSDRRRIRGDHNGPGNEGTEWREILNVRFRVNWTFSSQRSVPR